MNCRRFQELIAGDYTDGQLHESVMQQVREHLGVCKQCAAFEEALRKSAVEPFKRVKEIRPPDSVWERIQETIEAEKSAQEAGVFAYLKDLLRPVLSVPRPVFAAVALVIFTVTAAVILHWNTDRQISGYVQEQVDFLISLDHTAGNPGSFGTAIEQFYL